MKRKDDEKIMGPMFPRLHVNDTEKGGPRAPPRNKMALYEQLSIPSQRFNSRLSPCNPNSAAGVVPPSSSSQGGGRDGGRFFSVHLNHSVHPSEQSYTSYSDFSTPLTQLQQKKKLDEEDFAVPIFVQAEIGQDHRNNSNDVGGEDASPSPAQTRLTKTHNSCPKESSRTIIAGSNLRQDGRSQSKENLEWSVKSIKSSSARGNIELPLKQIDASSGQEHGDSPADSVGKLQSTSTLYHESRVRSQLHSGIRVNDISNESVRGIENGQLSVVERDSSPQELGCPVYPINNDIYPGDRIRESLQTQNGDRGDDASETSMVDSISGVDVSPDDVVGIIGQKQFWKARRAIVNQQRVFAVQVFELHRLIKVQRLIAGSPHLLVEEGAYLGKPRKASSTRKLPLEYAVKKPSPHSINHKDDSENPNHKMEVSAENAVGKSSLSSVQNASQPSNYYQSSGNPPSASVIPDPKLSPYCFHQPPGHQWLVPVMSPSEGLVFKPYPAHGFMGPFCGAHPRSNPTMGNFITPGYCALSSPHHQGIGVPSHSPPAGHGFFAPYAMPVISPVMSGSPVGQANSNFNMQQRSSCNLPNPKNGAIPNGVKPRASKESELQGSVASSPSNKARGIGVSWSGEESNALSLFQTSPALHVPADGAPQANATDRPSRVIKVVPHNARSATESAARIFQSIQAERRQHDSV